MVLRAVTRFRVSCTARATLWSSTAGQSGPRMLKYEATVLDRLFQDGCDGRAQGRVLPFCGLLRKSCRAPEGPHVPLDYGTCIVTSSVGRRDVVTAFGVFACGQSLRTRNLRDPHTRAIWPLTCIAFSFVSHASSSTAFESDGRQPSCTRGLPRVLCDWPSERAYPRAKPRSRRATSTGHQLCLRTTGSEPLRCLGTEKTTLSL